MKLTIYNSDYYFSEVLSQDYINQYIPKDFESFDCQISEITTDHPFAYGWLENLSQSKISNLFYYTNFTHIKFENENH